MVDRQIASRGIHDPAVLAAMRKVPRERFVGKELEERAYDDCALPIGHDQTISQPFIVAYMLEAAQLEPDDEVLEVGTGSGYAAAVLADIVRKVFTIEREHELADAARRRLTDLGLINVDVHVGDGSRGWPEMAPFNAILVAASGPRIPTVLKKQLAETGRLIMPVGRDSNAQQLVRVTRSSAHEFSVEKLERVKFVPLVGKHGWNQDRTG